MCATLARPPRSFSPVGMLRDWTPILMFHEVLPDSTRPLPRYAITRSRLRAILSDFHSRGFESGTLDDVVYGRRGRRRRVVLTFDDGTEDFVEYALPVLRETGFKATLFVVAGMVGGVRAWQATPPLPEVPLLDAGALRSLHAQGFTLGSHSLSHRPLPGLARGDLRTELELSKETLEGLTGEAVRWFAYPYVAADDSTRAAVRDAGYSGACGGYNRPAAQFDLPRIEAAAFSLSQLRLRTNPVFHVARQMGRTARAHLRP